MVNHPSADENQNNRDDSHDNSPTYLDLYQSSADKQTQEAERIQNRTCYKLNPFPYFRGWWKGTKWTDKTIALFTIVIAGAAVLQWHEMRDAGTQTDKIIAADDRIATAMEKTVTAADTALKATITQNELDQRAWVGFKYLRMTQFEAGKKISANVGFENTGRTIARHGTTIVALRGDKSKDISSFPYGTQTRGESVGVFSPGLEFISVASNEAIPQASDIEDIRSRKLYVFVYGEIHYDDVFGKPHLTLFCGRYVPDTTTFEGCKNHNDAN